MTVLWYYAFDYLYCGSFNYKSLEIRYDFCLHGWREMGGATLMQGLTTDTLKVVSLYGMCIPASLVEYSEPAGEILQKRDHVSHC